MSGRPGPAERGSTAVELVIIMPVLLLLLALVAAYGRFAVVEGTLEAGTRDAARAASQARTAGAAGDAAERAVRASLNDGPCFDTAKVVLREGVFRAGFPVTVTATCTYPMGDLGLIGVPGTVTVSSSFTSPVDPNRGTR